MSPTKFVFFGLIGKTRWPFWLLIGWDIIDFSSETETQKKQYGHPGLWLAMTFSTSPLKPLNRIQRDLIGSKISTSSTKFVFFRPIGKIRWSTSPLIRWDIFDFSETTEQNSTKLDMKQDAMSPTKFVFFGLIGKTRWPSRFLIGWDIIDFSSETAEPNSTKLDRKQGLNVLFEICVFFLGWLENQDGRLGLWLALTFSTSPLKQLNGIQRNCTGSKISTSSAKFIFLGQLENQDGCPGLW